MWSGYETTPGLVSSPDACSFGERKCGLGTRLLLAMQLALKLDRPGNEASACP